MRPLPRIHPHVAVRVRVPGAARLLRGVVREVRLADAGVVVAVVAVGLRAVEAPLAACVVVRKDGERALIVARVEAIRAEAAALSAALRGKRGVL
jgi:hypothetical protein